MLCGVRALDYSSASTLMLVDQTRKVYHKDFLARVGIRDNQLPHLLPSATVLGPINSHIAARAGLPDSTLVVSGSFDHPSAARGVRQTRPGNILLSCGTSWVAFAPCRDRDAIVSNGFICDPFLSADGGPWGAIASVSGLGTQIDRFVRGAVAPTDPNPYETLEQLAASYRGPGPDIDLLGLIPDPVTDRGALSRGIMESAARKIADRLHDLDAAGIPVDTITLVGGPSQSRIWPGIIQETLGRPVVVGDQYAGALGAAMMARSGERR
jgi:sugar (pentulose or hexulose) kinase